MKIFVNKFSKEIQFFFYFFLSLLIFSNILSINMSIFDNIYFFDLIKISSILVLFILFFLFIFNFPLKKKKNLAYFFFLILIIYLVREGFSKSIINFRSEIVLILLISYGFYLKNFKLEFKNFFYFILINNLLLILLIFPYFISKISLFYFLPIELGSSVKNTIYQNHFFYSIVELYNSTFIIIFCFFILIFYFLKINKFTNSIYLLNLVNIFNFLIIYFCGPIYLKCTIIFFMIFYYLPINLKSKHYKILIFSFLFITIFSSLLITKLNFHKKIYNVFYFIEYNFLSDIDDYELNKTCKNNIATYKFTEAKLEKNFCLNKLQYSFLSLTKRFKMQKNFNNLFFSNSRNILLGIDQNELNNLTNKKNFPHNSLIDILSKYGLIIFLLLFTIFFKIILNQNINKLFFLSIISLTLLIFFDDYLIGNKIAASFLIWLIILNPLKNYEF
jgi:hypothetical protein